MITFQKDKKVSGTKCVGYLMGKVMLLIALLFCGATVHAAKGKTFKYLDYTYSVNADGETVTLTNGNKPDNSSDVIIPNYAYDSDTDRKYAVTIIGDNAFDSYRGMKVVIGDNVQKIMGKAFEHFGEQQQQVLLILGKGLNSLDNKAFEHVGESGYAHIICKRTTPPTIDKQTFEHVQKSTFYVTDEATYQKYRSAGVWSGYDKKKPENHYQWPIPGLSEMEGGKWLTVALPEKLDETKIELYFGHGTQVAKLENAKYDKDLGTYHLYFAKAYTTDANTPYFIKVGDKEASYATDVSLDPKASTLDFSVSVNGEGKEAHMVGVCDKYTLSENEFYFRNLEDDKMYFYKADDTGKSFVKKGKCYFKITKSGDTQPVLAKVAVRFDDSSTTGISTMEHSFDRKRTAIYGIDGQYLGSDLKALGKGLYIVNGKKIVK